MFPETIRNQFLTLWSTFITWRNSFFWGGCSSKHHTFFSTSYQTYSLPIWCFSLTAQDHLSGNVPQVNGMSLSIGQIIAISITATAASIGAAGIPQVNKRIWNGNDWKIMFPYFFSRLAWWRWWWCSRRWDFLLRTSPSSWPSTGSSTGYRWWGWRQLVTDVQLFCIFVSRSHFSMLFHSCAVKESWKLEKDWICLQVPNNNQCAWRLPWGWNRLPPQQGRTWRFRKTAHQVSLVPSDTTFVRWLA